MISLRFSLLSTDTSLSFAKLISWFCKEKILTVSKAVDMTSSSSTSGFHHFHWRQFSFYPCLVGIAGSWWPSAFSSIIWPWRGFLLRQLLAHHSVGHLRFIINCLIVSLLVVLVLEVLLRGLVLLVMTVVMVVVLMVMLMLIVLSLVLIKWCSLSADWRARNITPWFPPYWLSQSRHSTPPVA